MRRSIGWSFILLAVWLCALVGCAAPQPPPTSAAPPPAARPTSVTPTAPSPTPVSLSTPSQPTGKLTPRLQLLADSPALHAASAEELARALGLPPQGPGSLVRDAQLRILVAIRTTDVSDGFQ